MASKIKPKTSLTQKRLEEKIDKLILSAKLNERNADDDILMQSFHNMRGVNIEYAYDVNEKEIDKIVRSLDRTFGLFEADDVKRNYVIGKAKNKRILRFRKQKKGSGRVKTEVQERGTTIVFENVLNGNADFKTESDIMRHTKTAKELRECFKGVEDKLDNWIWTFFQQQEQFIHEYSKASWSPFEYGNDSFVKFFEKKTDTFLNLFFHLHIVFFLYHLN